MGHRMRIVGDDSRGVVTATREVAGLTAIERRDVARQVSRRLRQAASERRAPPS